MVVNTNFQDSRLQPAEPGVTLGNRNSEKWESLLGHKCYLSILMGEWTRKTVSFISALNEWDVEGELRDPSWREVPERTVGIIYLMLLITREPLLLQRNPQQAQ